MQFVKKKIQNLRKKLSYWNYLYYIKNKSEVSDEKYDATLSELCRLEQIYPDLIVDTSPTQCIENTFQGNFKKISHKTPMLSLNSIMQVSQLSSFDERIKTKLNDKNVVLYCCELKIDGVAVSLVYKKGKLVSAATRGDGKIGEDVTENARTISVIPDFLKMNDKYYGTLPSLLEIRGEIFISKLCFLQLNKITVQKGSKPFSNSRNAASGSLRQLDPAITATRPLSFYCYGISYYVGAKILPDSHWERLQICKAWGLPISDYIYLINGIDKVQDYYSYISTIRSDLEFNIDGIVVKVDSCKNQVKLGYGNKAPNWALSCKFPAKVKSTKVHNVIFQVGRTGIITPIAYLEPIVIAEVIVRKVNIHNMNELKRLGLMIGDTVRIQRSGDVIPKILEVVVSERITNPVKAIMLPKLCPVCGSVIKAWRNQSVLRCMAGLSCIAQRKAMLKHFVSKKGMNINGIGDKMIDRLVDQNIVSIPSDFFRLSKERLINIEGYSVEYSERLLRAIENSKMTTVAHFIYALGIRSVGEAVANHLAVVYKSIENLIAADFQSLSHSQYVGPVVANNICCFFQNIDNIKNIKDLLDPAIGIQFQSIT